MRYKIWAFLILTILASAFCAPLAFAAKEYKAKPIPSGPAARTWKDYNKIAKRHNDRVIIGSYKQMGIKNSKWDTAALSFLDGYARWYSESPDRLDFKEVIAQGKAAVDAGCNDPIVLTCLGCMMVASKQYSDAEPLLKSGLDGFSKNTKLPRDIARLAPIYLLSVHTQMSDLMPSDDKAWRKLAIKWTAESVSDGSYLPDETRVMYRYLYMNQEDFFKKDFRALYEAVKSVPKPNKYFTDVPGGELEIKEAWDARGTNYSYAVTEENWEKFAKHLGVACKLLTRAWKLHPDYPEAPTSMITVTKAGHANPGDTLRMWFDRAVAAQLDYGYAYDDYQTALLPRWHGSVEELYDFGVECLKTKRFDVGVPFRFHWMLLTVQSESNGRWDYWQKPETIKYLAELYDGIEKADYFKDKALYPSLRAAAAVCCGRNDEAKQMLEKLGDKVRKDVFYYYFQMPYDIAKGGLDKGIEMGSIHKNPENGHYYELRFTYYPLTWNQAKIQAESLTYKSLSGHLATITSDSEGAFIDSSRPVDLTYWIGGSKDDKGWHWVTDEEWSYSKLSENAGKIPGMSCISLNPDQVWNANLKDGIYRVM